jgi:hypothetical protein
MAARVAIANAVDHLLVFALPPEPQRYRAAADSTRT